jgi:hypothetical protein
MELESRDNSVYVDVDDAEQCTNFGFKNDDGDVANGVGERKVSP